MIVVVDANYLIERKIQVENITKAYSTESVVGELKTADSKRYLDFLSFIIEVRNPVGKYVERVKRDIERKIHNLSDADIGIVALTLELRDEVSGMWIGPGDLHRMEVRCLTNDNGIKNALLDYDLQVDGFFFKRTFMVRCYSCYNVFSEDTDFCKKCGYSTLTKVAVKETEDGCCKIFLKNNYVYKPKTLKNANGVELRSADQREYVQYKKMQKNKKHH